MARLSKTRIMSSLQCAKRVHLEVHRRDLIEITPATQAAFDIGHAVGDIAIRVYGGDAGTLVPYPGGNFSPAIRQTHDLMDGLLKAPIYEATLEHEGVLIREDILLPHGDSWRVVEVKASTSVKAQHEQDCAIQAWVHQGAGYPLESIALGYVNNQWVWDGGDSFEGYIVERDLTETVHGLLPSVPAWVEAAKVAVDGPMPDTPVGQHCFSPYECPFINYCWPMDAEYPVHGLKGARKKLGALVTAGYRDIREVPLEELSNSQLRIAHVTRTGEPEILSGAGEFVRALPYPRFYLDFETVGPAVPAWAGTRPYETLPFQYSCHVEHAPDEISHTEFLDMSGEAPMRALAEQLLADLSVDGPVLMYTDYERRVLAGLAERFPDLSGRLQQVIDRLVDLFPSVKSNYYHPDMLGSWSIKAVLPTIAPDMDYASLEGVQEGTEASRAYLDAIRPGVDPAKQERIRQELLDYCRHDTQAMIELVRFFSQH